MAGFRAVHMDHGAGDTHIPVFIHLPVFTHLSAFIQLPLSILQFLDNYESSTVKKYKINRAILRAGLWSASPPNIFISFLLTKSLETLLRL